MVELVGRSNTGIYDEMANIGNYWGDVHDRAQRRWTDNEVRSERNRAQLQERELSAYDVDFYRQNAGLFDDRSQMLASVGQRNVPNAVPTSGAGVATGPAQLLGAPGGDPAAAPPATTAAAPAAAAATGTLTEEQRARLAASGTGVTGLQAPARRAEIVRPRDLTPAQQTAWRDYLRATRTNPEAQRQSPNLDANSRPRPGVTPEQHAAALANLRAAGLNVYNGHLVRDGSGLDARDTGAAADLVNLNGLPNVAEATTETTATGGATGAATGTADATSDDAYFQGIGDTSRPLQPTPEMQMAGAMTRRMFQRAQIYARNGNSAGSDQAFAGALQGQVAYIQAARGVLFQAAAAGSRDAAARLIADTSGLDPSAVQIQATPEREPRFIVRINTAGAGEPPNWVSNFSTPQGRDSFVNTLLNLYDRSGAAGRAEASQANYEAMLRYRATIAEVEGRDRVSIRDSLTRAEIAQLDSDTQLALAQGQGRMLQDSQTGAVWLTRPGVGPDGRPTVITTLLRMQDVQTPNVDDNEDETVQVGVRQDVY